MSRIMRARFIVVLAGAAMLSSGIGCGTKAGRSVVQVKVTTATSVTGLARVDIVITGATSKTQKFDAATIDWSTPQKLGVYLDSSVSGAVRVQANGFNIAGAGIATSELSPAVTVAAGKTTELVSLTLVPGSPMGGTGGAGGSGSGTGGAGGGAPGTGGGSGGGATGSAGVNGSGGASGGGSGSGGAAGAVATGGRGGGGVAMGGAGGGAAGTGGAGGKPAGGKSWQGAMQAEHNDLLDDTYPATAVDAKGNVVIAWIHGSVLWSNYFSATTGTWGTEGPIDAPAESEVSSVNVAVDKDGKWLVVWQQDPGKATHGIWQSTSADGVHWSMATAITTTGKLYQPLMAMNESGIAGVVWIENVPPDNHMTLGGSVRAANGTWSAPHVLKTASDTGDRNPSVAVTGPGDVVVAWEQVDDRAANAQTSIWMVRNAGGAWGTPALVESFDTGWASGAAVATNKAGQVVVSWVQYASSYELWARRYPATGQPEAATKIVEASAIEEDPPMGLTLDESGTATVAVAIESKNKIQTYTSRAAWSAAWSAPMAMETDNAAAHDNDDSYAAEYVVWPQLGRDAAGNVVLVWRKRVNVGAAPPPAMNAPFRWDLWARIFDVGTGIWGAPTLLETRDKDTASPPHDVGTYFTALSVGASGVAAVGWYYGWDLDVWANIYR